MSDFFALWLIAGLITGTLCLCVAVFWGLMSRAEERANRHHSVGYYKHNRKTTRAWLIASASCLLWPLALPAAVVYAVVVTVRYAFPRESAE
jgi:hypothetical protein